MITAVSVEHWRSHLRSELAFGPGVNVLVGMMGGGKSSVLDAICFALYGTFPALQQRRVTLDELLHKSPQQRDAAEVAVTFSRNGKRYRVARRVALGKGTVEAELRESAESPAGIGRPAGDGGWLLREANPANVTREVERLLGVDYDLFAKAIYAEQDGLDSFLRLPRGQRTAQIDRMLQMEGLNAVREAGVSLANRVEAGRQAEVRLLQEAERAGAEGKLADAMVNLASVRTELADAGALAERTQSALAEAQAELAGVEEREERVRALEFGLERARSALSERRKQLADVQAQLAQEAPAADRGAVEALRTQLLDAERAKAGAEQEERELRKRTEQLGSAGEACPVCEQPLPAERKAHVAEERAERLAAAKARMQEANARILRLGKELRTAEAALVAAQRAHAQREAAEASAKVLASAISELSARVAGLEQERAGLGAVDAAQLAALRKEAMRASAAAAGAAARERSLRARVTDAELLVKEREQAVARVLALRERVAQGSASVEQLQRFVRALEQAQEQLRTEYLAAVNTAMNAVWTALYPYGDFAELRLRREGDYFLELRGPGGWVAADGVASGGERALAALALRIAFALAFAPGLRWLVLDEPTHNLDSNAVKLLAGALRERLGGLVEQAFVVTHDERLAEAGTVVYRLERDSGKRMPTKVVAV